MTFSKNYKTIFLDVDTPALEKSEKVNIILSPSLYWVKKLTLFVKYVREVKKLLPSIFEDTLTAGNYNYSAYKNPHAVGEETEYFAFAYEDKKIIELLSQKNIPISNVASIRFAQSEMDSLETSYKIDESKSVYVKDDIVVVVPSMWLKESSELDLDSIVLSKHTISLQQFSHIIDPKSLYKIASIIVVLMILVIGELFITKQKTEYVEKQKSLLFSKNGLKSTMFQNKALLKKYKAINKKQTKLRKYIAHILSVRLQGSERLSLLEFKNKILNAKFSGVKKGHAISIESSLKSLLSKNTKIKKVYKNEILSLEISL